MYTLEELQGRLTELMVSNDDTSIEVKVKDRMTGVVKPIHDIKIKSSYEDVEIIVIT